MTNKMISARALITEDQFSTFLTHTTVVVVFFVVLYTLQFSKSEKQDEGAFRCELWDNHTMQTFGEVNSRKISHGEQST